MASVGHGIDPTQDAAGVTGPECFMCGKQQKNLHGCNGTFGLKNRGTFGADGTMGPTPDLMPQLALHLECLEGRSPADVAYQYHLRIVDAANLTRYLAREMYGAGPKPH